MWGLSNPKRTISGIGIDFSLFFGEPDTDPKQHLLLEAEQSLHITWGCSLFKTFSQSGALSIKVLAK